MTDGSDDVSGDTVVLDGFDVVAVEGEGVFVTDGDSAWHVGGPHPDASAANDLAAAYRDAFGEP
jgi:hypothetical protein